MTALKKLASVTVLATAAAFSAGANATGSHGGTYYPENPTPTYPTAGNNTNTNSANAGANATSISNAGAFSGSNSSANNVVKINTGGATGGAGGQGGQGGQGGKATATGGSANATGGSANAAGGNAAGGNATGGNAAGGTSNSASTTGASNSGGNNMSMNNTYKAPLPMGNVASTMIVPTGNCGSGFALNVSVPFVGIGGGKTSQDHFCLSQEAANTAINAGLVAKDTGMVAAGLGGLRKLHPEFDAAAHEVVANLKKSCAKKAGEISAMVLTEELECDGPYVAGTREFAETLEAPIVPVAAPAPVFVPAPAPAATPVPHAVHKKAVVVAHKPKCH
jgi:hypothetical protein